MLAVFDKFLTVFLSTYVIRIRWLIFEAIQNYGHILCIPTAHIFFSCQSLTKKKKYTTVYALQRIADFTKHFNIQKNRFILQLFPPM